MLFLRAFDQPGKDETANQPADDVIKSLTFSCQNDKCRRQTAQNLKRKLPLSARVVQFVVSS